MPIKIREAISNDVDYIAQLFKETIETVNAKDYSPEQIIVWARGASRKEKLVTKIREQYFLVVESDNVVVGFGSITVTGYLDFMYVSKDHQRKGIAQTIYMELEAFARKKHFSRITSDVSITARPFFEKQGFDIVQEQQVDIEGIKLINYKMQKHLGLH